ncbi:cytochrome P450 [Amycolatopsis thailandensis]|uniref:cytochrome P450 n=1 Tax=Amycolatopsis thailandensis TaxID=589330 RepID=UPI0037BCF190
MALTALRNWVFARVNGQEAVPIPGDTVGVEHFREVYAHPNADGRSEGAVLSDLFWYWLAPGPQVHQEHLEPGERYDDVARTTRRFLARPHAESAERATRAAERVLDEKPKRTRLVRLRDEMMPIWAEFYYELVFGEPCPRRARDLIVANATDVVTALKCLGLRHMNRRAALTRYLTEKLSERPLPLPRRLSPEEQVLYLQGTFFNTAVVQSSEAMTHLLLAIAHHPEVQARLRTESGDAYLDRVLSESFRRYPLFGIAHRISSGEITVDEHTTLPAGSVLCFNYADFHASGFADPERFDPDRWERHTASRANHIPFGVTANRPCPAKGIVPPTMRAVAKAVLSRYLLSSTATHVRSIPNRGPCVLRPVGDPGSDRRLLRYLRVRDRAGEVRRDVVQLVLGTYMVLDARRKRLAQRYFATHDAEGRVRG